MGQLEKAAFVLDSALFYIQDNEMRSKNNKETFTIEANTLLGVVNSKRRKYKKAVSNLNKALKLNPSDTLIRFNLANAYLGLRDFDQAELTALSIKYLINTETHQEVDSLLGVIRKARITYNRFPRIKLLQFLPIIFVFMIIVAFCIILWVRKKYEELRNKLIYLLLITLIIASSFFVAYPLIRKISTPLGDVEFMPDPNISEVAYYLDPEISKFMEPKVSILSTEPRFVMAVFIGGGP